ncbi:unnamed protein product [Parnassius mnemosyne]|uniref:Reverse transcriptase domain-containing protein n=1 Tax=Parnassius mnemosyne TaxID=213953 RepID=A0AAV1KE97_9NEOP
MLVNTTIDLYFLNLKIVQFCLSILYSPKLFTAALEDAFKLLDWKGYGININGEYITHLRFADDIVPMAESLEDLSTMLNDLNSVSQRIGLKMNMDKTKIMFNVHVTPMPVVVRNTKLEVVDEYVYLGQIVRLGKSNFDREVNRRIQLDWAAFGKLRHIFSSGIPQNLKTRLYTQCVLPVMTYGTETWSFTAGRMRKLKVAQRAMEGLCSEFLCVTNSEMRISAVEPE